MAETPTRSIRPSPAVTAAVDNNGGGHGFSHRMNQIADRYLEILRRAPLPAFDENELNAIRDALNGTLHEPAAAIRGGAWTNVENACLDGLAGKQEIDGHALVQKLQGLSFAQEVRLFEEVEAFWSSDAGPD